MKRYARFFKGNANCVMSLASDKGYEDFNKVFENVRDKISEITVVRALARPLPLKTTRKELATKAKALVTQLEGAVPPAFDLMLNKILDAR